MYEETENTQAEEIIIADNTNVEASDDEAQNEAWWECEERPMPFYECYRF